MAVLWCRGGSMQRLRLSLRADPLQDEVWPGARPRTNVHRPLCIPVPPARASIDILRAHFQHRDAASAGFHRAAVIWAWERGSESMKRGKNAGGGVMVLSEGCEWLQFMALAQEHMPWGSMGVGRGILLPFQVLCMLWWDPSPSGVQVSSAFQRSLQQRSRELWNAVQQGIHPHSGLQQPCKARYSSMLSKPCGNPEPHGGPYGSNSLLQLYISFQNLHSWPWRPAVILSVGGREVLRSHCTEHGNWGIDHS